MTFDEVRAAFVGKSAPPQVMTVEAGAIKLFAVAVGDLNPLYLDEEYASRSECGTLIAPPGFFGWPVKQPSPRMPQLLHDLIAALVRAGYVNILDGENELELFFPIRAGDTLVHSMTITDLYTRTGSGGREMAFFIGENTYFNQNGEIAAKFRQTVIAVTPSKGN